MKIKFGDDTVLPRFGSKKPQPRLNAPVVPQFAACTDTVQFGKKQPAKAKAKVAPVKTK